MYFLDYTLAFGWNHKWDWLPHIDDGFNDGYIIHWGCFVLEKFNYNEEKEEILIDMLIDLQKERLE